jgi:hypothetical protein
VKKEQIGICKKMSQDTKLKMQSRISESAAATTSTKKRASDAGLVTKGLVSAAAAEALSKRSRPSASTGSGLLSLKRDAWNSEGEDFGGLGLGKWDNANVVALTKQVGAALWQNAVH